MASQKRNNSVHLLLTSESLDAIGHFIVNLSSRISQRNFFKFLKRYQPSIAVVCLCLVNEPPDQEDCSICNQSIISNESIFITLKNWNLRQTASQTCSQSNLTWVMTPLQTDESELIQNLPLPTRLSFSPKHHKYQFFTTTLNWFTIFYLMCFFKQIQEQSWVSLVLCTCNVPNRRQVPQPIALIITRYCRPYQPIVTHWRCRLTRENDLHSSCSVSVQPRLSVRQHLLKKSSKTNLEN